MRKIREVLRLKFENDLTNRKIARSNKVSRPTVALYLAKADEAGLSWPLPDELDDAALENLLFPNPPRQSKPSAGSSKLPRPQPDTVYIHKELRHKYVTLQLLWEEYKRENPEGYQYSRFCDLYHCWARKLDVTMRQDHKAGDKLFIDYAGPTIEVFNPETSEVRDAYLFVAVLGASNYTYAEASFSQDLTSWITSHVHAFNFFSGVARCLVPDNLPSGVSRACRYEPDINPTYQCLATHYGTAVMPARVRRPRDKAKVEAGVLVAERWILAVLRHRTFFNLSDLNTDIKELLNKLNNRKFRKLNTTRAKLFEELDRPALLQLPAEPFRLEEIKMARVHIDYHVELGGHYYSVPYQLVHEQVEARITATTVEILYKGQRIATHPRSFVKGRHTTQKEHRPKSHQKYLEWNPARIIHWAESIGAATTAAVSKIMESRSYPEQGFRSCLGILRLAKSYSKERLEAACARALTLDACSYKSIKSILKTGLDRQHLELEPSSESHSLVHLNVRGAAYYQSKEVADAATTNH